jgi:hypothetical protein
MSHVEGTLSLGGRRPCGILQKTAANIQAVTYQTTSPSETTRELIFKGKATLDTPTPD